MSRRVTIPLVVAACASCARPGDLVTRIEGATMGTRYSVQVVDLPAAIDEDELRAGLAELLRGIEGRMSTYDPGSELSRFNASRSTGWFPVSADTAIVVAEALRVGRLTGGAFDVTVAPLVDVWGFGPMGVQAPPTAEAVREALATVDYSALATRADPPAIRKRAPDARVDLSAIAKGFAVDELAGHLLAEGVHDFLVDIGGELRAAGRNPAGARWRIAIERPPGAEPAPTCVLQLVDGAVATSGDYRNAYESAGVRYAHVIDPRTGQPVSTGVASATVLGPSAMLADAIATALMVLPPEEGLRLAASEGLAARILVRDGSSYVEHRTPGFQELTTLPEDPAVITCLLSFLVFIAVAAALGLGAARGRGQVRSCGQCPARGQDACEREVD